MVDKTSGIPQKLKQMLASFKKIECAFIFGSFAKGVVKSHSDIDLIIIGDVGLRALSSKLKGITDNVQREINPHIYSRFSWNEKLRRKDHFIRSVSKEPKLFLVGDENVLG